MKRLEKTVERLAFDGYRAFVANEEYVSSGVITFAEFFFRLYFPLLPTNMVYKVRYIGLELPCVPRWILSRA